MENKELWVAIGQLKRLLMEVPWSYRIGLLWRLEGHSGLTPHSVCTITGQPPKKLYADLKKYGGMRPSWCYGLEAPTLEAGGLADAWGQVTTYAYYVRLAQTYADVRGTLAARQPKIPATLTAAPSAALLARHKQFLAEYPWPRFKGVKHGLKLQTENTGLSKTFIKEAEALEHDCWPLMLLSGDLYRAADLKTAEGKARWDAIKVPKRKAGR